VINTELVASSYPSGLLQVRLCLGNPASREPFPGFPILLMGVACLTVPGFGVMRLEKGEADFQAPRLPSQPPPEAKSSAALHTTIIITFEF
jgi:hypothetical protein